MAEVARIDKWLWATRVFKTRSLAADACKNGRVTINGINVKPSHIIKAGETVSVKKSPITYSFKVLKCIEQRVGAKLLPEIYENVRYEEGLCPVAEKVQRKIMQFKTNYRDIELAKLKAEALYRTIRLFS